MLPGLPKSLTRRALRTRQAELAGERSLADFVRVAWPEVEQRPYRHNWHIEAVCEYLESVNAGTRRALICNLPPRHSKSLITTVFWPAWTWLRRRPDMPLSGPRTTFAFASWSASLSIDHNMTLRRLVGSEWYQYAAGPTALISRRNDRSDDFRLVGGGRAFATSVNSNVVGFGFDIRVADDPNNLQSIDKSADRDTVTRWYDEVWKSRVEDPKASAEVVIMQRAHKRDLVGHILGSTRAAEFDLLCLPAEYDPKHPHVSPRDERKKTGELLDGNRFGETGYDTIKPGTAFACAAQMQQNPMARGSTVFANAKFEVVGDWPQHARAVRFWDKAATEEGAGDDPDYTAGVKMALWDGVFYVIDVVRKRLSPRNVRQRMRITAESDGVGVNIYVEEEGGSAGKDVTDDLQRDTLLGFSVTGRRATGHKLTRIDPYLSACEAGNVKLVRGPWNAEFLAEHEDWTGGDAEHDDQIIASAGAHHALTHVREWAQGEM